MSKSVPYKMRYHPSQRTAKTPEQVMWWIESVHHHIIDATDEHFVLLKGHTAVLRVPPEIWKKCYVKAGEYFDQRFYRWDHEAAAKAAGFSFS